jgi:parvulin-like peptidyl-prolyl isomerase
MKQRQKKVLIVLVIVAVIVALIPLVSFSEDNEKDKVLAVVGNKKIMQSELSAKIEMMPQQFRARYASEESRAKLLDQLIKYTLLSQEARSLGIDKKEDVVKRVDEIVNNIIIQELTRQEVSSKINITDTKLEEYYNSNIEKFTVQEKIKVVLIFIEAKDGSAEKKKKAEMVLGRLKKGEKIEDLVKQFSDDLRTNKRGGTTGYFARGRRVSSYGQAFEDKAFSMKQGKTSGVVKSKDGFYIINVVVNKAEKKQTLDEVRPRIERTLKQSMQKEVYDEYLESLKKKYPVKLMD